MKLFKNVKELGFKLACIFCSVAWESEKLLTESIWTCQKTKDCKVFFLKIYQSLFEEAIQMVFPFWLLFLRPILVAVTLRGKKVLYPHLVQTLKCFCDEVFTILWWWWSHRKYIPFQKTPGISTSNGGYINIIFKNVELYKSSIKAW